MPREIHTKTGNSHIPNEDLQKTSWLFMKHFSFYII